MTDNTATDEKKKRSVLYIVIIKFPSHKIERNSIKIRSEEKKKKK